MNLEDFLYGGNQISDIHILEDVIISSSIADFRNQKLSANKEEYEMELPQIFIAACSGKYYMGEDVELEYEGCKVEDTKVIIYDDVVEATVKIKGGQADGTTLTIRKHQEGALDVEIKNFEEIQDGDVTYIEKIQPNQTAKEIKDNIETNGEIKIFDKNNNEVTSEDFKITTGTKVVITNGAEEKEYVLVVKGDVNGDGESNFNDMLQMNKHRLQKKQLSGAYLRAGELDGQEGVTFSDMLKLNKYRLGKISSL